MLIGLLWGHSPSHMHLIWVNNSVRLHYLLRLRKKRSPSPLFKSRLGSLRLIKPIRRKLARSYKVILRMINLRRQRLKLLMIGERSRVLHMIGWRIVGRKLREQRIERLRLRPDLPLRYWSHIGLHKDCILEGSSATGSVTDTFSQIVSVIRLGASTGLSLFIVGKFEESVGEIPFLFVSGVAVSFGRGLGGCWCFHDEI